MSEYEAKSRFYKDYCFLMHNNYLIFCLFVLHLQTTHNDSNLDKKQKPNRKRPVFLFIHGESYEYGSGNAYDLSVLVSYSDTIGITLNYRLGLLGFLFTNNHAVSGNYALYDLHAAIMWIKTNIASFNGNPNEITLIGYGHGAALLHLFSLSKMSQGTTSTGIKRIILLNGSGFAPWSTSHQTLSILTELLKHLNITEQNLKNATSLNEIKHQQHHNTDYLKRHKSLFAQTDYSNSLETLNDSKVTNNVVNLTRNNMPLQLMKQLVLILKNSTVTFLMNLQEKLTQSFITTRLGPVISKYLFPSYLLNNSLIKQTESVHRYRKERQQHQWYEKKYSHIFGKSNELNGRMLAHHVETSLFMNVDLLIGWTEAPASSLYYSHANLHKMPYSLVIQQLVNEIYPYNQDVIKEIIEYAYCYSGKFHFDDNKNDNDVSDNSEKQFKEIDCNWKILDILSDGLYIVPIIQTLKMHSDHYTNQEIHKRLQDPSSSSLSSSLPSLLFTTDHPSTTRSKEQINNNNSKNRKSTYALFFNYKTIQQMTTNRNTTDKQLHMSRIGFGDDLPYLLGAPLISPNQLEPFSNEYTEKDKKISVNLMNYLTNFMHNGDPNKEFIGYRNKKTPVHWPEYTYDSKNYLYVGDDSRNKQSLHPIKNQIRNLWGNKENEQDLFTIKQLYETDKHKLWSTLFPSLTFMNKKPKQYSKLNQDEKNIEKYSNKQRSFNNYFYFLQLNETDWWWSNGQMNKMQTMSNLFPNNNNNNNQNIENLLNIVDNSKLFETEMFMSNISSSTGNFSQLPLYKENDIEQNSNRLIQTSAETNELLMNFNLSNKSHSIDETNTKIQSYSQSLTTSKQPIYSHLTLIWIIMAGSMLFLLNTLIFIAIYYQTHQLRKNNLYQQSKSSRNKSTIIQGTEPISRIKRKPISNFRASNKNQSWQTDHMDGVLNDSEIIINNAKNNHSQKISLKKQKTLNHHDMNNDDAHNSYENIIDNGNIITLIDGKRLTGLNLYLPSSNLNPVIVYYGVRYASLGVPPHTHHDHDQLLSKTTTTTTTTSTNYSSTFKSNNDNIKMPAMHRFSHSVASFFYESPIGVYSHSVLPPVCPQPSLHIDLKDKNIPKQVKDRLIRLLPFLRNQDEDCLTLNIYVPQSDKKQKPNRKRPVFLFIHGESYEYGSGYAYDLSVLVSYSDTIGITLNYRLGLLGFLFTNNHAVSGNYALYDLHAAIMWIKTNIASFNGNPNEITLIGYGHGAALLHLFSLSKMSQGTTSTGIKRIILLNGSGFAPWSTSHQTLSILTELLKHLNITEQNLKNATSLNEIKHQQHHNTDYLKRHKSLFAQTDYSNSLETLNDSKVTNNVVNLTRNNMPLQLMKQLVLILKNSTVTFLMNLQEKLTQSFITTRLGPVISKYLFPSYLLNNSLIKQTESVHRYRKERQQHQWYEKKYSHIFGKSNELNGRMLAHHVETSLFMNVDLLIGWTEAPASSLYYSHANLHKMPYNLVIQQLVNEIYPYNQDVIKEIIEYAYCYSGKFHFDDNKNDNDVSDNSEKQFKEIDCNWKILGILSDGLYIVPIIQTLKMHSDHNTNQEIDKQLQHPSSSSSSSSLPSLLFTTDHPSTTRSKEQINNNNNSKNRKSTYALFFNYKTIQQMTTNRNTTDKQLHMSRIGFGDDLPYLLGAPLISPNQLEPFSNEYTERDKKISVNLMNYLTNFMHNGDPNKEFIGYRNKKTPVHWPEYTYDSKNYLYVGDDSRNKQSMHPIKNQIRNLWGNKENEQDLFTIKQLYETDKHKLWSTLFPSLTFMNKKPKQYSKLNQNEKIIEKYPSKQRSFNNYFYFLQLNETDWWWSNGQMNKMQTMSNLFLNNNNNNNNQNIENLLNIVDNSKLFETEMFMSNISSSTGNFSQLPLYRENDIEQNSNRLIQTSAETNELLMNFNLSNKSHSIDETNTKIQSYSQSLTTSKQPIYSHLTLIWIIMAGSMLFLLNTLIFIAIYYQTHQLRKNNLYQQSKSSRNKSTIIQGTEPISRIKRKPISNFRASNKNQSWQTDHMDGDVSNTLCNVTISSSNSTSLAPNCYAFNDLSSYSLHKPQHSTLNTTGRNQITSMLYEIPTVTLNHYNSHQ
ncbi:unnamed protein product [Schistosoma turkestanicum]|nr:unnamed protein product [Schistosoma turkestanicum]